ncbi:hypothetical protein [Amycolatopsis sp. Hca4]|uniref:hypothetical protein n=1 Tax=Amycolatopsis sp. Hca4 TaxID=2742131 RepID=UPI001591ADF5|nr:hypothetical protein [Amycolatopsis sp. Hca4]QKV78951.1 hypothetical protein HUT10_38155 [Amycolatopsis sp. Hca4]
MPGPVKPLGNAWLLAAARSALDCGDLAEIRRSTRNPLTLERFWANLTGAWHRTLVTVPADPFAAERKFCGGP